MFKINKKAAFCLLLSFAVSSYSVVVQAQTITKSPYSRFGVGDLQNRGFAQNFAMGGTGVAINSPKNINIQNTASLVGLNQTTFEVGANMDFAKFSTADKMQRNTTANLAYLALAFPVSKRWASTIGLTPYSSVGYKVSTTIYNPTAGNVNYTYEGNGGINKAFIGNAFKVTKDLSLGMNISYLFGSLNKVQTIVLVDSTYSYNTRVKDNTLVGDLYFDYGMQYTMHLKEGQSLIFGATLALPYNVSVTKTAIAERFTANAGYETIKDTLAGSENAVKGKLKLPMQYAIGISYRSTKWFTTAEYSFQQWSKYQELANSVENLTDGNAVRLGAQYQPNVDAVNDYLKLVQYRLGVRYGQSNLLVNGQQLNEMAISAGMGFPIRKTQNVLNISAEIGQRGTTEMSLIKEQFVRLSLGVSFSDRWFIKRKYD